MSCSSAGQSLDSEPCPVDLEALRACLARGGERRETRDLWLHVKYKYRLHVVRLMMSIAALEFCKAQIVFTGGNVGKDGSNDH